MQVAIVVYDGVFDSGLAAILDVLNYANALGGQIHEPPTWNVTMVGPAPQVLARFARRNVADVRGGLPRISWEPLDS